MFLMMGTLGYYLIRMDFFLAAIVIMGLIYLNIALSIKTVHFFESQVRIKYPFRIWNRTEILEYEKLESAKKGSGTYLDGTLIIIHILKNGKSKKRVFNYPDNETWVSLVELLERKKVKIL